MSYKEHKFDFVLQNLEKEGRLCAKTNPDFLIQDIKGIQHLISSLISTKVITEKYILCFQNSIFFFLFFLSFFSFLFFYFLV